MTKRTKIGEMSALGQKRDGSFSKRAMKGNLTIISKKCKFCNHNKAIQITNTGATKCSKCKRAN